MTAIIRNPSALDGSILYLKNIVKIPDDDESAINSGRAFLMAMAVTCSEGGMPGLVVRIREPKFDQTI